jgi:hypothetical protein
MKAFVFACVMLAGCVGNQEPPRACTLIGCNDGLNVTVNSAVQQDYSVTVKSGTQTLHTFSCRAGQPCMAFLENQTPAIVTVQITTSTGTTSRDFTPEYKLNRPNGPGCDPECKQATITAAI